MVSFLDREKSVAPPGCSRWSVPPSALAVHLSIDQVHAFSVFKAPPVERFDSSLTATGVVFGIAIVMLGFSAAFGGKWVELNGPRRAMFAAAVCWGTGFLVGAPGAATGMAIMGFGGGALIASPLSAELLDRYADTPAEAIVPAFLTLGAVYFEAMVPGALVVKVPPPGWRPAGWEPPVPSRGAGAADGGGR